MPIKVTNHYVFAGPVIVSIHTEHEMATVLEITVDELRSAIERGEYAYHVHPDASGSGTPGHYQFTPRIFLENVDRKIKRDRAARTQQSDPESPA